MRQKAMKKSCEPKTPPHGNQVKNQSLHNAHSLRGACNPASSLRAGLQAWEGERLTVRSHYCKYLWKFQVLKTCSAQLQQQIWEDLDPIFYINICFYEKCTPRAYRNCNTMIIQLKLCVGHFYRKQTNPLYSEPPFSSALIPF